MLLPDVANIPAGGPFMFFRNTGSQSGDIANKDGTVIQTLTPGTGITVNIAESDAGVKTFVGF